MLKNRVQISLLLAIVLSFLVFLGNAKFLMNHCLSVFNYGIFQQGVFELAAGNSFNPMMTVRGLKLFNDHFPPILFLTAPFIKILNFHPLSLLIWEYLWFIALLFFVYRSKTQEKWLALLMIVFSKGLLKAMELPGHPGVWPAVILAFIPLFIKREQFKYIMVALCSLMLFRESYVFMFFGLSLSYLFINRDPKKFLMLFLFGVGFYLGIYKGRPYFLGEIYDYGNEFISQLTTRPFSYIWERTVGFDYKGLFKTFYPYLIPLFLIRSRKLVLQVFLMLSPLLFLHFLANKFSFQYGPMFAAPILGLIIFSGVNKKICENKKLLSLVLILFLASSMGRYTKMVKRLTGNYFGGCETSTKKALSSEKIYLLLEKVPLEASLMATPGIIPRILKPGMNLYHPGRGHNIIILDQFEYMLIERNETGGTLPLKKNDLEKIINQCRPYETEQLYKDHYYYFAKGNFPKSCFSY